MYFLYIFSHLSILIFISSTLNAEQNISPRLNSTIDWDQAYRDHLNVKLSENEAISKFRSASLQEIDNVTLPVLILKKQSVRSTPKFFGQGRSYVATYSLPKAKLSIIGSATLISLTDDSTYDMYKNTNTFEVTLDGADYSFIKYGASYILRLSCDEPTFDMRCTTPKFLNGLANQLIVAGGKAQE
ncbi:MAG: hypothetical protein AB2794_13270 [Candidatus Thiodiazotropha endolucinida]